jgi:hypothetical protein
MADCLVANDRDRRGQCDDDVAPRQGQTAVSEDDGSEQHGGSVSSERYFRRCTIVVSVSPGSGVGSP